MLTTKKRGIHLAIIAALISGLAIFVNKFAAGAIKPPLVFIAIKNAGVGLLIIWILFTTGKWQQIRKLSKKDFVNLLLIGCIGGTVPFYLFFTGISQIPSINAAILHKTLVLWVAIFAIPFLKERLSRTQIFAVLLLFGSNLILGGFEGFQFSKGELFVLIATVLWAGENILIKKTVSRVDPDLVIAARMVLGSLILLGVAGITVPQALRGLVLTPSQWFWIVLTMATLLSCLMFWYRALKFAPATTVASVLVLATLVTNVLSAIFVTHTWKFQFIPQAGLMFLGILIFWLAAKKEVKLAKVSV